MVRSFVSDVAQWARSHKEALAARIARSPLSGLPDDVAAAYVRVAQRSETLLDAMASERLRLAFEDREAVRRFCERMNRVARNATATGDEALRSFIESTFELSPAEAAAAAPREAEVPVLSDAAAAEPPAGVRARRNHFSASALNAYAECERKWYYRYVCAAVEDPGSSASFYGTAFHAALEDFHGEFPRPSAGLAAEMRKKLTGYVNWAFERHRNDFDSPLEVELQKRRAQRTAVRYVDWLVAESELRPFTVIGREATANLDIDGFAFVGYIDRLDRDDATGAVSVIDYKTGNIALSARDYRDKVRSFRDFQLPYYYWARTAQGDRVTRLALIPLKDALLDVAPVSLEVVALEGPAANRDSPTGTIPVAELERARARMAEICRAVSDGRKNVFPVTDNPDACRYCAYRDACRLRPEAGRERFAR